LAAQQDLIDQLKNELDHLDSIFAGHLKAAGLTEEELSRLDPDQQPPEVKKLLEGAQDAAKKAGEERAQAARSQSAAAPATHPSRRGGAVRA
jgi:peptidoglycan hydrolase CwlO-like protein